MSNISAWSTSAASNNAAPPDGWPEGQSPGSVNDVGRENMAAVRRWYVDAQWIDHGFTWVRQSNNSFIVSGTATEIFSTGRRLKMLDTTTILGEVIASSPSGVNTLVTVSSSNLSSSLSSGSVGIIGGPSPGYVPPKHGWQVYATPGTYTLTGQSYMGVAKVTVVGAGGAGGSDSAATNCVSEGGGGGGTAIKNITISDGVLYTVVVGSGGTPVVNSTGATGGTSSFGGIISATGGTGGQTRTAGVGTLGGGGASGSGGDINLSGGFGQESVGVSGVLGGGGGDSFMGEGAPDLVAGVALAGAAGQPYGGGGSGGSNSGGYSGANGGVGGGGIVIVEW